MRIARKLLIAVLAGSAALAAPTLEAQVSPALVDDPALTALIEEALAANPDVLAAQAALDAALARPDQARSLPDPMLSTLYTNEGWSPSLGSSEDTTLGLMGSQAFPYPGKRRLRGDIARQEAAAVAQRLERVKLRVAADVARAYFDLLLARDLLGLVGEQGKIWKQIEEIARTRYVVGQGVQQDVLRVQVEVTRVEQLLASQRVEIEIRTAELNRLLARPATGTIESQEPLRLRPSQETLDQAMTRLNGLSPELEGAAREVERAGLVVELARKDFRPDFNVQTGYMNRGSLDPMWQAGVGVNLPLYRRRIRSGVAEAEAALRASERLRQAVSLQLRQRTQQRLARIATTQRIAEIYEQGIVPQDRMSVDAALASYQTGKVPFIAVLEALATLYGDRSAQLALLATHAKLRASLEEASLEEDPAMGAGSLPPMPAAGGSSLGMTAGGGAGAGRPTM